MLAIKATATQDGVNIEGIIPLETAPPKPVLASVEPTHGNKDIPMNVHWCIASDLINYTCQEYVTLSPAGQRNGK